MKRSSIFSLAMIFAIITTLIGMPVIGAQASAPSGLSIADWQKIKTMLPTASKLAQDAFIKGSNTATEDWFGFTIAASGNTVVVGASQCGYDYGYCSSHSSSPGGAYIFVRDGENWTQQAYLQGSNTEAHDNFGFWVDISGDTVVVGAPYESSKATGVNGNQSDNSASLSGAAYVFVRNGTVWSQQAYLKASNTEANDIFGYAVAVEGDRILVGAPYESSNATGLNGNQTNNNSFHSGAVYIFTRSGTNWNQQAYLKASNTSSNSLFGHPIAVSESYVVIGASSESSNAVGVNGTVSSYSVPLSGAAYIFTNDGAWTQEAYLKASNPGVGDYFGTSLDVSGATVVVTAYSENNNGNNSGAAYVFTRNSTTWSQQAYIKAPNAGAEDLFGYRVSLSGNLLAIGAVGEDSNATGVNGNQEDNSADDSGAVYLFSYDGTTWKQQAYLKASNTNAEDWFSMPVILENTVIVGAPGEASNATGINGDQENNSAANSGAIYVFSISTYVLDVAAIGVPYGTVTSDPTGINCDPSCSAEFAQNTVVELTASPAPDRVFFKWLGACESYGSDPVCYVTMDQAKSVKAIFHKSYYWKIMAPLSNPTRWGNASDGSKTFTGNLLVEVELNGQWVGSRNVEVSCREVKEASGGSITPPAQAGDRADFYMAKLQCALPDIEQVAIDLGYPSDGITTPHYEIFSEPISADSAVIMRFSADSEGFGNLFSSPSFVVKKLQNSNGVAYTANMVYTTTSAQSCSALGWDSLSGTTSDPNQVELELTPSYVQWNEQEATMRTSRYFDWLVGMNTTFTIAGADASGQTDMQIGDIEIDPKTGGTGGGLLGATVNNLGQPGMTTDMTAGTAACSISGNAGMGGVTLVYNDLGGAQSVVSDTNGNYALPVSPNWSGMVVPSKANYEFTPANRNYTNVTSNITEENYIATLLNHLLTVQKIGAGVGAVTSEPSGIDCGLACSAGFAQNTVVTLTAVPASGSVFVKWLDACATYGSNPVCPVTMDQAKSAKALFLKEYAKNGSFEAYSANNPMIPTAWSAANNSTGDGKDKSVKLTGAISVKFTGMTGKVKTLAQTLTLSGAAGDPFLFSYWVKGSNIPTAGACKAEVIFYNGTTVVGSPKTLPCGFTGTFAPKQRSLPLFNAPGAYTKIVIRFTYAKASGSIWFDGVSLLR